MRLPEVLGLLLLEEPLRAGPPEPKILVWECSRTFPSPCPSPGSRDVGAIPAPGTAVHGLGDMDSPVLAQLHIITP